MVETTTGDAGELPSNGGLRFSAVLTGHRMPSFYSSLPSWVPSNRHIDTHKYSISVLLLHQKMLSAVWNHACKCICLEKKWTESKKKKTINERGSKKGSVLAVEKDVVRKYHGERDERAKMEKLFLSSPNFTAIPLLIWPQQQQSTLVCNPACIWLYNSAIQLFAICMTIAAYQCFQVPNAFLIHVVLRCCPSKLLF
ncbi:hypothetical protein VNO77_01379 [Canavalia gladiata]|uniref:Uncharacterized protein n=1 Tax=Canavalia gladiata TaxID=3824 RepID=A0AAN9R684_CANGL